MAEVIARVIEENGKVEGGFVELSNGETTFNGRVAAVSENEFLVDWEDGARTVENKADYELVVASVTKEAEGSGGICQVCRKVEALQDGRCPECAFVAKQQGIKIPASVTAAEAPADFASTQTRFRELPGASGYGLSTPKSLGMGATPDGRCYTCGKALGRDHKCIARDERGSRIQTGQDLWTSDNMKADNRKGGSVTAAENPAQPAGWAVAPVDADAYPGGELIAVEMEKRQETAEWEDAQNRAPIDGPNPAQAAGWAVPEATNAPIPGQGADGLLMAAKVTADDISGENGEVELVNGSLRVAGRVIAADDDSFIVEWEDERRTVENKSDYDLIIRETEEA